MGKGADNAMPFALAPPTAPAARTPSASLRSDSLHSYASSISHSSENLPNAVHLNIYDVLTPDDPNTIPRLNNVLVHCGIGIFHTGIEVWGREFAFGGHPDDESGIFEAPPRQCPSVKYRTTMFLGFTRVAEKHVEEILHFLGTTEYAGNRYSLIARNCNTFSRHFAALLGVQENFPHWVNRLAGIAVNIKCILPEGVDLPAAGPAPPPLVTEPQEPPPVALLP